MRFDPIAVAVLDDLNRKIYRGHLADGSDKKGYLCLRVAQWFAAFEGQQMGEILSCSLDAVGDSAQHIAALVDWAGGPRRLGGFGRSDGPIELLARGHRSNSEGFLGCRIDNGRRVCAIDQLAVDQKLKMMVHGFNPLVRAEKGNQPTASNVREFEAPGWRRRMWSAIRSATMSVGILVLVVGT